ncbi:MAG: ribonuclease H-like domain-containing protein [Lachnospiraceae bacterium]|jgi:hypothetical protein
MNKSITRCKNQISNLYTPYLDESCAFLSISSDGYYWRTSKLGSADIIALKSGEWYDTRLSADPENEEDEYLILEQLCEILPKFNTIFTFNGTSFTIPYLKSKFDAYDLPNPFQKAQNPIQRDLYMEYKALYRFLKLPSRKLSDFSGFLGGSDENDAEMLLNISRLLPYTEFLKGEISPIQAVPSGSDLVFIFKLKTPVPVRNSFNAGPFYVLLEDCIGKISVKTENGYIKHFYPDYRNYEYLPEEGFAIHKSLSSFVEKSRKIPAQPDTAFTLIKSDGNIKSDLKSQKEYINSVIVYIAQKL